MNKKSISGFTMIEMLIAIIVLSIGLIGIAALQARGQQFNYVAYVRTQASFLAYDIMDRMRLNQKVHVSDNEDIPSIYSSQLETAKTLKPSDLNPNCDDSVCSAQELAKYDLVNWFQSIKSSLPEGNAEMTLSGDTLRVTIKWQEGRSSKDETRQEWVYQ